MIPCLVIVLHMHPKYICNVNGPSNLSNLQLGWPICQSQISQPICKWDDLSEEFLNYQVLFSKCQIYTALSQSAAQSANWQIGRLDGT